MTMIQEVMSTEIVSVGVSATVAEAATIMSGRHVGSALVLEDGRLIGIFTERDILRALGSDFDAAGHEVGQWMTPHPVSVAPGEALVEARDMMLSRGFRHLPVVDGDRVLGVVSIRDLTAGA